MEEFTTPNSIKSKLSTCFPSINGYEITHVLKKCVELSKRKDVPITWHMLHNQTVAYVRHNKTGYDSLIDRDGKTPEEARVAVASFVSDYMKMLTRKRAPWLKKLV